MASKSIHGSIQLGRAIRQRRNELSLTIEEAAKKAGVGTKTWSRYEAGESIRTDKVKGLCRVLQWQALPEGESVFEDGFDIEEYKSHLAWSPFLAESFGEIAAVSFVIGSDILLDHINEDLEELSRLPKSTHIGQLGTSFLAWMMPEQFLMRYDYEFLFALRITVETLRGRAHAGVEMHAHSVMEELAFYLFTQVSELLMEEVLSQPYFENIEGKSNWEDWIYDLFDDMDLISFLYSDLFVLDHDHMYHFDHWGEDVFYV